MSGPSCLLPPPQDAVVHFEFEAVFWEVDVVRGLLFVWKGGEWNGRKVGCVVEDVEDGQVAEDASRRGENIVFGELDPP